MIGLRDGGAGDGPGGSAELADQGVKRSAKTVLLKTKELFGPH